MKLDPKKTALLTLDMQKGILGFAPDAATVIPVAAKAVEFARKKQFVLSTLRRALDLDFRCVVLKDACFDADPEVRQVLTEKFFPRQATVLTADAFITEQGED